MPSIADEVISLKLGSEELEELRDSALKGDRGALSKYVYFCALQQIRSDKAIPEKKKNSIFRRLVSNIPIEVNLG